MECRFGWESFKRAIEGTCKFIRFSGRFPKTATGKLNTYAMFSELAYGLIARNGRVGIIVQSGVATDDGCKEFFGDLVNQRAIVSLFDFVNLEGFFPGIHRTQTDQTAFQA